MARADFNVRFDPRGKDAPRADFGEIGEDAQGIWVRRHPEMILVDEYPGLMPVFDAFTHGQIQVTADDWRQLSAPEYDAKLELAAAHQRGEVRSWESGAAASQKRRHLK